MDRISKRLGLAKPYDSVEKVEEKLKRKIDRDRWNRGHHEFIFLDDISVIQEILNVIDARL